MLWKSCGGERIAFERQLDAAHPSAVHTECPPACRAPRARPLGAPGVSAGPGRHRRQSLDTEMASPAAPQPWF